MLLCVDLASKKAKVTVFKREKRSLKVLEYLEFDVSELEKEFGEYLERTYRDIDEIRVSGALDNTFHKIFIIPDLKGKMFTTALGAEVTKAFGVVYQFKYQDIGEVPGPGNKVNRKMMTAGIKRDNLEELSKLFEKSRIPPNIYTTYPLAVQALVQKLRLVSEEPMGFLELDYPTSRIVIFKEGEIRVAREVNVLEEGKDPDRSALAKDIYRTLLFYTENYPNELVTRIVLAQNSTDSKTANILAQKTGAEIIPFSPEAVVEKADKIPLIPPGCLGLALLDPDNFSFEFVPMSIQEKRKTKKTLSLSASFILAVVLILALAISRYTLDLGNLNNYQRGIKGEIKMKEDRLKELGLEFVSHTIETTQPPWSEVLLEMAATVPPGVIFESFVLKKTNKVWTGEIVGLAEGKDEISSLLLVESVQNNFNQSPLFKGVKLVEKELQGKRIEFKINYQLNM
jgi:hypothetical protein